MNKRMRFRPSWTATILGAIATSVIAPVQASSLTADGLTYTLTESSISPTEDRFTLGIAGINGPSDTEGGRYGVNSFAFTQPTSLVTGTAAGFTYVLGGLNASGCNMTGNFFCFVANTTPSAPPLTANSTLQYTFDLTVANANDFVGYSPDFKIEWLGANSHYNLVSQTLSPTPVPIPASLPLFAGGIAGLGFMRRRLNAA